MVEPCVESGCHDLEIDLEPCGNREDVINPPIFVAKGGCYKSSLERSIDSGGRYESSR